jgi:hypothetical protein
MTPSIRPLTQEQRQTARQIAYEAVIRAVGAKPMREQFRYSTISKYPPAITRLISGLCLVLLLSAFTPSAIRLYVIGSQTFGQAVSSSAAMTAVGLATVLSAEVGQVVFSLALATLGTSRSSQRLLYISMGISTILSLVGNIQISLPSHTNSPFAWLEAIAPPVLVLSTAYVLKEQVLEAMERRHADERAFQAALTDWQFAVSDPEEHPQWRQFYANALRDALRRTNNRRQETLTQMTQDDWRIAVTQEIETDLWYEQPDEDEISLEAQPLNTNTFLASRNGNSPKAFAAAVSGDV